jgi:hypothetical protein
MYGGAAQPNDCFLFSSHLTTLREPGCLHGRMELSGCHDGRAAVVRPLLVPIYVYGERNKVAVLFRGHVNAFELLQRTDSLRTLSGLKRVGNGPYRF